MWGGSFFDLVTIFQEEGVGFRVCVLFWKAEREKASRFLLRASILFHTLAARDVRSVVVAYLSFDYWYIASVLGTSCPTVERKAAGKHVYRSRLCYSLGLYSHPVHSISGRLETRVSCI